MHTLRASRAYSNLPPRRRAATSAQSRLEAERRSAAICTSPGPTERETTEAGSIEAGATEADAEPPAADGSDAAGRPALGGPKLMTLT